MKKGIAALALATTVGLTGVGTLPAFAETGTTVLPTATKYYTKSQVARHNTAGNCWTIIGTDVYNLTGFVHKHPGGSKRIIRLCGKNGTSSFRGQHGSGGRANTLLKSYKIGKLK